MPAIRGRGQCRSACSAAVLRVCAAAGPHSPISGCQCVIAERPRKEERASVVERRAREREHASTRTKRNGRELPPTWCAVLAIVVAGVVIMVASQCRGHGHALRAAIRVCVCLCLGVCKCGCVLCASIR